MKRQQEEAAKGLEAEEIKEEPHLIEEIKEETIEDVPSSDIIVEEE
jgi:hypothetical protein